MGLGARLRDTPLVAALRAWRRVRALRGWSGEDEKRAAFYRTFLTAGDLCFDVGANLGNRSKVFLALGARVVAVEPQAECATVLRAAFGARPDFMLIEQALGAAPGSATIRIPEASTIASMSPEWIEAVRASGRFAEYHWDRAKTVPVTTLDALIAAHGVPAFVKIDVEGFEGEVVRGLSHPVGALSMEFTPERLGDTFAALEHLGALGRIQLNYAMGEDTRLALDSWVDAAELRAGFAARGFTARDFGDVYARFPDVHVRAGTRA
jgi:FkbM family methyltransferase